MELKEEQIEISVCDPQKIGEGMSAYVIYNITTRTNLPYFEKNHFSISRRFSSFLYLREKLVEGHLHLGRIVPPAPEKSVVAMMKVKLSKDDSVLSDDFIEKRRAALERYLNRIASHPVLRKDSDFQNFLENESGWPKSTNRFALSGAGVFRFFSWIEETFNKMTFKKMDDTDPLFEEKQRHIEKLDEDMRKMRSTIEAVIPHHKAVSMSTVSFTKSAANTGMHDEGTVLFKVFSQLPEVEKKMEQLQLQQANGDFYFLSELLNEYIGLLPVVKKVFNRRMKMYLTWKQAQETLNRKREERKKIELVSKSETSLYIMALSGNITVSRRDVIEWEEKIKRGKEAFENISKTIRNEIEHFEQTVVHHFEKTMVRYVENLLKAHHQMFKCCEEFLPGAKALA